MRPSAATFTVVSPADAPELVVKAEREIDIATAPQLREVLTAAMAASPEKLIVDIADVSFIDSSCLSEIIVGRRRPRSSCETPARVSGGSSR
jgi:anti-anti-sigma factor